MNKILIGTMLTASLSAWTVQGMTMSELQGAVDAAISGATVELTGDVEVTESLNVNGKVITIKSPENERYVFRRSDEAQVPLLTDITDATTDVRLENLEYDGRKASGRLESSRLIAVAAGKLTFGPGTLLRDVKAKYAGPIAVSATGHIVMEDGAAIRGFVNDVYATAVLVGTGNGSSMATKFEMKGGEITGCESTTVQSGENQYYYGGAIYVYKGYFIMSGGIITGNTATHTVGGVLLYQGNVDISGTAVITGNTGKAANDAYRSSDSFYVSSNYRGRMTVQDRNGPVEGAISPLYSHQAAGSGDYKLVTGLGNISYQGDHDWVLDGYTTVDGYTRWRKRFATTAKFGTVSSFGELQTVMQSNDEVTMYRMTTVKDNAPIALDGVSIAFKGAEGYTGGFLKGAANMGRSLLTISNGASVRFKDITIDGANLTDWEPLVKVGTGSQVVLDSGTTICNALTTSQGGMAIRDSGTVVTMEEGAKFTNCCARIGGAYGVAVMVGGGGSPEVLPKFEMKGGEITGGEVQLTQNSVWGGYGGEVYVYSGLFKMSGGRIYGNISSNTCPGVLYYSGKIELSGTARIDDNTAPYADLFYNSSSKTPDVTINGGFRGHVGISYGSKSLGGNTFVKAAAGATGAWCLFQKHPDVGSVDWCGQLAQDGATINWAEAVGKVDYMSVASVDDANAACPKTVKVDMANLSALPHTFKGKAAEIDGVTVALDFDAGALKQYLRETKTTIPLFTSDKAFTGNVAFAMPKDCPMGFNVQKSDDGCSYYLGYGLGMILLFN